MSWDHFVKVFHWSLATGIVANYFFLEDGDQPHEWLGYGLCALIVCRILWGIFGPASARFASFLRRPSTLWQELTGLATAHELPDTHTTDFFVGMVVFFSMRGVATPPRIRYV